MIADLGTSLDRVQDLRHRVRRLGWFRESFEKVAGELNARHGCVFLLDDRRLAAAFLDWAEAFAREHGNSKIDRHDFVVYSGGLMLKQLLRAAPATARKRREPTQLIPPDPLTEVEAFWPEGFLYVHYCLTVVGAILKNDFDETVVLAPCFEDLRVWQSFRENVKEDPSLAVPFFDLFLGRSPNWTSPDSVLNRRVMREAEALAFHSET
jgi:hypothetical protein